MAGLIEGRQRDLADRLAGLEADHDVGAAELAVGGIGVERRSGAFEPVELGHGDLFLREPQENAVFTRADASK